MFFSINNETGTGIRNDTVIIVAKDYHIRAQLHTLCEAGVTYEPFVTAQGKEKLANKETKCAYKTYHEKSHIHCTKTRFFYDS